MMIWRPVLAQIATLAEIRQSWTICDLFDAHEALDVQAENDEFLRKQAMKNAAKPGR